MWRRFLPEKKGIDLITGGAGFVGSHLAEHLISKGRSVRILDDFSTGLQSNLKHLAGNLDLIEGSVQDPKQMNKATKGVEVVYHLAAIASVQKSIESPEVTHDVCVTGTLNTLEASRKNGCRRMVFAASSSAYGNTSSLEQSEHSPLNPMSPYAAAKLAGEFYCQAYSKAMGIETVRLRFFNIYGPRQRSDSPYSGVIAIFANAFRKSIVPKIFGDGLQSRDFVHVLDAVQALFLAGTKSGISGEVFNIGTGIPTSLLQMVKYLQEILGTNITPTHEPERLGDVRHSLANIKKAQMELGYTPEVSIETGLQGMFSGPYCPY